MPGYRMQVRVDAPANCHFDLTQLLVDGNSIDVALEQTGSSGAQDVDQDIFQPGGPESDPSRPTCRAKVTVRNPPGTMQLKARSAVANGDYRAWVTLDSKVAKDGTTLTLSGDFDVATDSKYKPGGLAANTLELAANVPQASSDDGGTKAKPKVNAKKRRNGRAANRGSKGRRA